MLEETTPPWLGTKGQRQAFAFELVQSLLTGQMHAVVTGGLWMITDKQLKWNDEHATEPSAKENARLLRKWVEEARVLYHHAHTERAKAGDN